MITFVSGQCVQLVVDVQGAREVRTGRRGHCSIGVLFVLGLMACHGSTTSAMTSRATTPTTPTTTPPTAIVVAPQPSGADLWFREIVDPAVLPRALGLSVGERAISVVAVPDEAQAGAQFVSDGSRWTERSVNDAAATRAVTWAADGSPILLLDDEQGISVKRGPNAPREMLSISNAYVHDITTDAGGVPHVCFAAGREQEATELFYGTPSKGTKKRERSWGLERLPMSISSCRVIAGRGQVHLVVTDAAGVSVLTRVGGEAWRTERLSSDPYASAGGVRTATGVSVVGYTENQTIHLLKFIGGRWQRSEIVTKLASGSLRNLVLAAGSDGAVHVAFRRGDGSEGGEVHYASEESPKSTLVARDRTERIALALDSQDQPHLAYVATWPAERRLHLIHARLRATDEGAAARYVIDEARLLQSCASAIAAEVGYAQDPAAQAGARRWCRPDRMSTLPPPARLVERCQAGEVDACLVAAARAAPLRVLTTLELAHDRCEKPARDCPTSFDEAGELAPWMAKGRDVEAAITLLEHACSLGSGPACMLLEFNATDARAASLDVLAKACDVRLPIACAALLIRVDGQLAPAPGLLAVRRSLRIACKDGATAEGCNALAFMEEAGLGGPRQPGEAVHHHVQACERGAALSCIGLLTSRTPPRPPPKLALDRFEELLSTRCSELGQERACLALATAYNVGWGLPRDAEKARTVLEGACEAGMASACTRMKRRAR